MQDKHYPNIFLFNPTCEYAVANGNASWQANRLLQKMEADMATLPLYFANKKDIVLVPELPDSAFHLQLEQLEIEPPEFIAEKHLLASPIANSNELRPWGWSPAVHKRLEHLKPTCAAAFKASPVFNWKTDYRELYSKKFARSILHNLVKTYPSEHFIAESQLTEVCTSHETYLELLQKWGKLMVKAPWSSSGRGLQPVRYTPIHPKVWDKLLGIIKDQGYAIVEPYLDKVIDLAFQFKLKNKKVSFIGISNFSTDYKGQYNGNSLNGLPDSLHFEVKQFITYLPKIILPGLTSLLEQSKLAESYEGYFGVDTLIFRDQNKQLKVNPCLEINVRHNMGLLSLYLEKFIHPTQKGRFLTYYDPKKDFASLCNEMKKNYPLQLTNHKIVSGFCPLTAYSAHTKFGAYLLV